MGYLTARPALQSKVQKLPVEQRARLFRELDLVGICSLRIKEAGVKGPLDPDGTWNTSWHFSVRRCHLAEIQTFAELRDALDDELSEYIRHIIQQCINFGKAAIGCTDPYHESFPRILRLKLFDSCPELAGF